MRYWDALLKERDIQNHRAFLFVIAKNLVIDWYRKKKSVSLEALAERDPAARGPDDISLFFLGKERGVNADYASAEARHLAEKIKELDSIYQEVVYLRLVEELLPREISVVLGLSVNVISVRVNRGIKKLRILAGYDTKDERKGTSERNRIAAKRKNDARRKTPSL